MQTWLRRRRPKPFDSLSLLALVGVGHLAMGPWAPEGLAQAIEPGRPQPAPPAIPLPPESTPPAVPSQAPKQPTSQQRPTSQQIDGISPAGGLGSPASVPIQPGTAGSAAQVPPPGGAATDASSPTATAPKSTGQVTIDSDLQQADQATGIITATGNVRIIYPDQKVVATARQAQYFTKEDRVVLTGDVDVIQEGGNHLRAERVIYLIKSDRVIAEPAPGQQVFSKMVIQQKSSSPAAKPKPPLQSAPASSGPAPPGAARPAPAATGPATSLPTSNTPTSTRPAGPIAP